MSAYRRFPRVKTAYLQSIGKILPRILRKIFLELGFGVWINPDQGNGVDLELYDNNGRLVVVIEVLNWSPFTILFDERKDCIVNNLTSYDCVRLLVYTAMSNEDFLADLPDNNIYTIKIGYQVLTHMSYKFFEARNQVIGRKINTKSVKRHIKQKIIQFLELSDANP